MNKYLALIVVLLTILEKSYQASLIDDPNSHENGLDCANEHQTYNLRSFMRLKKSNLETIGSSCVININRDHLLLEKNIHDKWPLVLVPGDQPSFVNVDKNGDIILRPGEKLRLVCSGDENRFVNIRSKTPDIIVMCNNGKFFNYMGVNVDFKSFGCAHTPNSEDKVIDDGHHQIGFRLPNDQFLPLIDVHYNKNIEIIHVTHKIPNVNYKHFQTISRIPFQDGNHPLGHNVDRFYNRRNVNEKIVKVLGNKNARKYFNDGSSITRGHMAPKADFIFGAQQLATFFLININPQFSGSNNINWNFLEMSIRDHDFGQEVTVHTGASRIVQLPSDISAKNETIFLGPGTTLPIPEFYWKIVEVGEEKYSFIGLNYPSIRTDEFKSKTTNLCNDVCDTEKYSWLDEKLKRSSSRRDFTKGYLLCCSYEEIEKVINKSNKH